MRTRLKPEWDESTSLNQFNMQFLGYITLQKERKQILSEYNRSIYIVLCPLFGQLIWE
jgi:hypothetical protein